MEDGESFAVIRDGGDSEDDRICRLAGPDDPFSQAVVKGPRKERARPYEKRPERGAGSDPSQQ